ncbi:MAG: translesion error-prone DNA polymerase V autoproteolytic subunit [Burkholderiaceae bacterium]
MNSIPATAWLATLRPMMLLVPTIDGKIAAGFPSPADDFLIKRHDLNELLVTHPQATFFWQVSGHSMRDAGIADGDILVVNRALKPRHGSIVVAQVDGEFTVKTLFKRADRIKLVPANPTFPEITFREGQQLIICGVVTASITRFASGGSNRG